MDNINILLSEQRLDYDGSQLHPHFILEKFGIQGNAVVAFLGACNVRTEALVDWEDRLNGDKIVSAEMVHFVAELFDFTLRECVLFQWLIMSRIGKLIEPLLPGDHAILSQGDDLYILLPDKRKLKLSVAVSTRSAVSSLMHFGINLDAKGAPVPAIGLRGIGIENLSWIDAVLEMIQSEYSAFRAACTKVRPVI